MKEGKIAMEILVLMIVVVVTSAAILVLVQTGVITVKEAVSQPSVLNVEFLPLGRVGSLAVSEFNFCNFVDEGFNCLDKQDEFLPTENVYVRFVVESSTFNGEVLLVRNYRIRDPSGEVVLEVNQENDYNFEVASRKKVEPIVFADFFIMGEDAEPGKYTLDVLVANPLLDKRVTLSKKFTLVEEELE